MMIPQPEPSSDGPAAAPASADLSHGNPIKDLLLDAIELAPEEREAFLASIDEDDADLGRRLRDLVSAWANATAALHDHSGAGPLAGHIASAAAATTASSRAAASPAPGDRIGSFILGEKIGEGAFGIVHRARQEFPVRRDLALKLLKPGMDSHAVIARFDAERQALARLAHPAIARIYDAGSTPDGRPFFAMDYVDGRPINDYCDDRRLPIPRRLELFLQLCDAVQHAHQKGIIHRDLKPSNVLVTDADGRPQPRVIDFGIAKAIDEPLTDVSMITLARQIIGTPRYMPPEQAGLDPGAVDTRSDVYSLGVMLYELLCGAVPVTDEQFRSAGLTGLHTLLSQGRFPRPSQRLADSPNHLERAAAHRSTTPERLRRALAGDLDWIAMKAIDPDPARRYPSAFALGRDVERAFSNEPVEARPPSAVYLARKFINRHRAPVAAASFAVLALVAGLVLSLSAFRQAAIDRDLARDAGIQAAAGRDAALQAEAHAARERDAAIAAREEAEASLAEAQGVTDFVVRMITAAEPTAMGRDVRVADLLDQAALELNAGFDGRPTTQARLHSVLAQVYRALGDWRSAETQMRLALAIREDIGESDTAAALSAMANLASMAYEKGDVEESIALSGDVLKRLRETLGPEDPFTIGAMGNHALMLASVGRLQEAFELEREVLDLNRTVHGPNHPRTIGATHNLGNSYARLGDLENAERLFQDALQRGRSALGDGAPETLIALESLATFYHRRGRNEEARPLLEEVVDRRMKVLGPDHPQTMLAVYNFGANALQMQDFERALPPLIDVLEHAPDILPVHHPVHAAALVNLITVCDHLGWSALTPEQAQRLVASIQAAEPDRLSIAQLNVFAYALAVAEPEELRDYDAAVALAQRVVTTAESIEDPFLFGYLDTLATCLYAAGRRDEALAAAERALELVPESDDASRAAIRENLERIEGEPASAADL